MSEIASPMTFPWSVTLKSGLFTGWIEVDDYETTVHAAGLAEAMQVAFDEAWSAHGLGDSEAPALTVEMCRWIKADVDFRAVAGDVIRARRVLEGKIAQQSDPLEDAHVPYWQALDRLDAAFVASGVDA